MLFWKNKGHGSSQEYLDRTRSWEGTAPPLVNLANLPAGNIEAVIGSPPYANEQIQKNSAGIDIDNNGKLTESKAEECT